MIFGKKAHIVTDDDQKIEYLLTRGVEQILPSADFLRAQLKSGKKLRIYTGIDPTGPFLHLGHFIFLEKLRQFQELGHEIIFLIGGFTATIGDPSGKDTTRKVLSEREVSDNAKKYIDQAAKIISFKGKNGAKVLNNIDWLKGMNFGDILRLEGLVTVDQMLKRDMFERRVSDGKPIFLHEFMYPLMQGYDSVAMEVDVEVGGNDQLFNMLMGRDLLKKLKNKEKLVVTMKLLADTSGKKMGKSEGNMLTFLDSPQEMYGKVMSWTDGMITTAFELCTRISNDEIRGIEKELKDPNTNPRDLKMKLAREIVKIYYSEQEAQKAENNFTQTFQKHQLPEDIKTFVTNKEANTELSAALLESGLVESMSEFKRLVKEGAITINGEQKVESFSLVLNQNMIVKVGKKRFLKIEVM